MRFSLVVSLLLVSGVAHADLTSRAGYFRYLVGTGITQSGNITSVTNPSAGIYTATLTRACQDTAGIAVANGNNGARRCFADFATTSTITISCRNTSGTLQDLQVGDILMFFGFCGIP